jgi:hypothetical protein
MNHIWSILCQSSSIDEETKLLSIFNCLEQGEITTQKKNAGSNDKVVIPTPFELISFWAVDEGDKKNSRLEIKIEIIDPNNVLLNSIDNSFDIKEKSLRFRSRIKFQELTLTENGRYYFKVSQKYQSEFKIVASLPLDIKLL